jgi:hypothetical protein
MSKFPIDFTVTPTGYLSCSGDDLEVIDTLTAHARRQAQGFCRKDFKVTNESIPFVLF